MVRCARVSSVMWNSVTYWLIVGCYFYGDQRSSINHHPPWPSSNYYFICAANLEEKSSKISIRRRYFTITQTRKTAAMDSGGKIPTTEIKAQLLRDVDEGRISTNAAELINACSALLQMSGKNEHSGGVGEHDTSSTVHGQQTNHATLLKGNAFSHADTTSAGAVTKDLNSVSPEEPNFVSCQKPLHAGEKSVRRPLLPTRSRQPMEMRLCAKDTLWMQNYRELQVSFRYLG